MDKKEHEGTVDHRYQSRTALLLLLKFVYSEFGFGIVSVVEDTRRKKKASKQEFI
jgi:hypothetical protein